ncbi:MAG: hypothetical protein J1F03_00230 [Oscillospiraceae bacterium]|nr:hypothetical protein [Oscillospiraceae bacterium]
MDDNVVDSLRIEITGDSGKAANSIEKLISTLERLKTATSGASNVTKTLESSFQKATSGSASALKSVSSKTGELKNAVSGVAEKYRLITNEINKTNAKLDALYDRERKMDALGESKYSKSWKSLQYDIEQAEQKLAYFKEKQEQILNDGSAFVQTPGVNVDTFVRAKSQADLLKMKIKETKNKLQELLNSGNTDSSAVANLVSQIKGLESKLAGATQKGKAFKKVLSGISTAAKGVAKGVGTVFGKTALLPIHKFGNAVKNAGSKVGGLFSMFKRRVLMRSINAVISTITSGFKEGTANVYQYSKALGGTLASSLDSISTSFLYLKNSIGAMVSPLINMAAPAIDYVIDKFVDLLNTVNQVFAKLSGASTWTKAVRYPTEYAEAADAATAANKELKKSILGIDELNTLTDNNSSSGSGSGSGMDYSKMFEEVELAEINNPFKDMFKPFADAWANEGQNTINSIKKAFSGMKGFISAVKESFHDVWTNGTGQQTVETVLRIFQDLLNCVGNIGSSLKKAWKANNNGKKILQNIWNIFNDILGFIEGIYGATADWLAFVDFTPLMTAFGGCTAALEPLADLIGNTLSWLYQTVLLPIASWTIEEAAPASIDAITAALEALQKFLQPLFDGFDQLWNGLKPIVKWVEDIVIVAVKGVKSIFEKLAATFQEKGEKIQNIVTGIGEIIAALWPFLEPVFNLLTECVSVAFDFIGDTIGGVIGFVIDILSGLTDFLAGVFTGDWDRAWKGLQDIFINVWEGICGLFTYGVNNMLLSMEGMTNGVIKGLNNMINELNKLTFTVPDWIPDIGGKKFGFNIKNISEVSFPRVADARDFLPRLADGGMVNAGTAFIAGEAGAEVVANIGKRTGVMNIDQMRESVEQGVIDANAEQNALLREEIGILRKILDKDVPYSSYGGAKSIISDIERKNRRDGKTVIPVGV